MGLFYNRATKEYPHRLLCSTSEAVCTCRNYRETLPSIASGGVSSFTEGIRLR